jgi:hypothetical protein
MTEPTADEEEQEEERILLWKVVMIGRSAALEGHKLADSLFKAVSRKQEFMKYCKWF